MGYPPRMCRLGKSTMYTTVAMEYGACMTKLECYCRMLAGLSPVAQPAVSSGSLGGRHGLPLSTVEYLNCGSTGSIRNETK